MNSKYLNDDDSWMLAEDIPDCDLFWSQICMSGFANEFETPGGIAYKKVMTVHRGSHLWFYFGEKDSFKVGDHIAKKFLEEDGFIEEVNKNIPIVSDELRTFADSIPREKLESLSNEKLSWYFTEQDRLHTEFYRWCWLPAGVDMFHGNFTKKIKEYLIEIGVGEDPLNEYFTILTQPTSKSLIQLEEEEFLEIAALIYKDSTLVKKFPNVVKEDFSKEIWEKLQKHYEKYHYVTYMWIGKSGVHSFEHYLKEITQFITEGKDALTLLKSKEKEFQDSLQKREDLLDKLNIEDKWRKVFKGFGDFMVTKIYRRYGQMYALYRMEPLVRELARRLHISYMQSRFMLTKEIEEALIQGKVDREVLDSRTKFSVHYCEKDFEEVYIRNEAKKLSEQIQEEKIGDVDEMVGQTGCLGYAVGEVKQVIRPADMAKMNEGDILVSIATDPDIVPAMKKAAAFVTDQGGMTSHAAIVAREMNKPCVIGTKIATRVLQDGDYAEVDAHKGIVKKISKEEYLSKKN